MRRFISLAMLLACFSASAFAGDGDWKATVVRNPDPKTQIEGLKIESGDYPVTMVEHGTGTRPVLKLKGTYKPQEGWSLISGKTFIRPNEADGAFTVDVPIEQTGNSTITIMAIGPLGEAPAEKLAVQFEGITEAREEAAAKPERRNFVNGSAGYTYISYTETGLKPLQMHAVTVKATYSYLIKPPRWDFAANTFFTAFTIGSNRPEVNMRFLGINARVGYILPSVTDPWQVSLMGGWYYITTFVNDNLLGFVNLAGPQFFPTVKRSFLNGDTAYAYFKYSPLTNGVSLSLLSLSNREVAVGGGWTRKLKNGHPVTIAIDISNFSFFVEKRNRSVEYSTFSLSGGYGF